MRQAVGANPVGRRDDVIGHAAKAISRVVVSSMINAAAGLPSRGCPTEPATASQRRPLSNCTGVSEVGMKLVIFAADDIE